MRWTVLSILLLGSTFGFAEPITLRGFLIGDPPPGLQEVQDELNRRLLRDKGVRLELHYLGWNELNSRYPLVLAAGEGVDWIFTADWAPYAPQAVRGAFLSLHEDMVRWNMPRHWAATPRAAWDQAMINGGLYMIPTATPDRKVPVAVIRGDIRKAAGLGPVASVADLEPYLAAVKARGGLVPMALGNGYDIGQPFMALINPRLPPILASFFGTIYGRYDDSERSLVNLLDPEYRPAFVAAAKTMKRWYDLGYLNRAPFANRIHSKDAFASGRSGVGFGNSQDILAVMAVAESRGYQPEIIPILSSKGHSPADAWTGNGVAVAATCPHPELVLQVLDLLMEDPDYVRLVSLGIEGRSYQLTDDGRAVLPAGVSPADNPYPFEAAGFWFVNKAKLPPVGTWSPAYRLHQEQLNRYLVPNFFHGFTYSPTKVKAEIASITTVMEQYWAPLVIGAVSDVEKAVSVLERKLGESGQDRALADLKAQIQSFNDQGR